MEYKIESTDRGVIISGLAPADIFVSKENLPKLVGELVVFSYAQGGSIVRELLEQRQVLRDELTMAKAQVESLVTVNDELHNKLNLVSEAVSNHRKAAFVTCEETCFCWSVETLV